MTNTIQTTTGNESLWVTIAILLQGIAVIRINNDSRPVERRSMILQPLKQPFIVHVTGHLKETNHIGIVYLLVCLLRIDVSSLLHARLGVVDVVFRLILILKNSFISTHRRECISCLRGKPPYQLKKQKMAEQTVSTSSIDIYGCIGKERTTSVRCVATGQSAVPLPNKELNAVCKCMGFG